MSRRGRSRSAKSRRGQEKRTFRSGNPKAGGDSNPRARRESSRDRPRGASVQSQRGGSASGLIKGKATLDKNEKGFAFLSFESRDIEDLYLPPEKAAQFFHGDRVLVVASPSGEVIRVQLLEHRFKELVARYYPFPEKNKLFAGRLIYEKKRSREEVPVSKTPQAIATGHWVRARLSFHEGQKTPVTAEVVDVYGEELPASADIHVVASEFNLVEDHAPEAIEEAEKQTLEIPGQDLQGRKDLRNVPFITIDGETARDFDDAVFVERKGKGFLLWVAVADVSHYVREGRPLDKEARKRGTSVYFPERAFHMLPSALSEGLCSLRPNEPRLAMVAQIEYNSEGKPTHTEVFNAVIQSRRRATYNQIEAEFKAEGKNSNWEFRQHFDLYRLIRSQRENRGSIDFDLPEVEVLVDAKAEPVDIVKRERLDSHRLIEEFMIAANEAVTEWMRERRWPFIYRIHEEPSSESLERFQKLAATVGFKIKLDRGPVEPVVLAKVTRELEGHPAQLLLNNALLRSMRQAIYSATHGIHYGLASQAYTHFTSPIRRYPDLVVHRLLKRAIAVEEGQGQLPHGKQADVLEQELEEIAEHCSYRERLAAEAERENKKIKQVRLLRRHLGDELDGRIVGMIDRGIFAQLDKPFVEGLISRDSLTDDFYEFNEERMIFYGKRKRRTFKIGDRVKVKVLRTDLEKRQVDFALIDSAPGG